MLAFEIQQTLDTERRDQVLLIASGVHQHITISPEAITRAKQLEKVGFGGYDALHLACAEQAGCDVFLTTDDKVIKLAERQPAQIKVQVLNPLKWLEEVRR